MNGCPVCLGAGRLVAITARGEAVPLFCPECAGLAITPASADEAASEVVEPVEELAEPSVGGAIEAE
jgi:hypothetical protein